MTFSGLDIQAILEETLPGRFGGTVLDYQLIEEDDDRGISRMQLLISPRVTIADERGPIDMFLGALRAFSSRGDATGNVWQQAGTLTVVRREPFVTARGKQPVVIRRRAAELVGKT